MDLVYIFLTINKSHENFTFTVLLFDLIYLGTVVFSKCYFNIDKKRKNVSIMFLLHKAKIYGSRVTTCVRISQTNYSAGTKGRVNQRTQ